MPIRHVIDPGRQRVHIEIDPDFTFDEILEVIESMATAPGLRPGFRILSDHTRIDSPLSTPEVRQLVRAVAGHKERMAGTRMAVVTRKPASYGMMRMLSTLVEDIPMELDVFLDRDEAEAWLARP